MEKFARRSLSLLHPPKSFAIERLTMGQPIVRMRVWRNW